MAILVGRYLRARAWWRLDSAGAEARRAARSVVALLDAASYMRDVPDDDPDIVTMEWAGCFRSGAFDPGPVGAFVVRGWQLAERTTGGPRELLAALAAAATTTPPLPRQGGRAGGTRQEGRAGCSRQEGRAAGAAAFAGEPAGLRRRRAG